jgi:8-oxo-dGTP diphosphatase
VNILENCLTLVPVVAVALLDDGGQVLMQQRRKQGAHGGLWEFPGGKVKAGESPELALVREIREELGVAVDPADLTPFAFSSDPALPPLPREPYVILLYTCVRWTGDLECLAGEAIGWFTAETLAGLAGPGDRMPPLDVPLARALLRAI